MNRRNLVRLRFLCFDLSSLPFRIYSIRGNIIHSLFLLPIHQLRCRLKKGSSNLFILDFNTSKRNEFNSYPPSLLIKGKEMKSLRKLRGYASLHKQAVHKNPRDLPSFSQSHELAKASQVLFTPLPLSFLLCLDFAATKHDYSFFLLIIFILCRSIATFCCCC